MFDEIVRRYSRRLHRTALSVLRDEFEAEDVVQESFLSAYLHLNQFQGKSLFSTWLTRIAFYNALARKARHRRESLIPADPAELFETLVHHAPNPEEVVRSRQYSQLVEAAITDLPGTYREVFFLREIEELDTAQTAARLKISESNVKVRLHRARHILRRHIESATSRVSWQLGDAWRAAPPPAQTALVQ